MISKLIVATLYFTTGAFNIWWALSGNSTIFLLNFLGGLFASSVGVLVFCEIRRKRIKRN